MLKICIHETKLSIFLHVAVSSIWGTYPVHSLPLEVHCLIQDHLNMSLEGCPLRPSQAQRLLQALQLLLQVAMELFRSFGQSRCLAFMRVLHACQGLQSISMSVGPLILKLGSTFSKGCSKDHLFVENSHQKATLSALSLEGEQTVISKSHMIGSQCW